MVLKDNSEELATIFQAFVELDDKISGGIDSLFTSSKDAEDLKRAVSELNIKLLKNSEMLLMVAEKLDDLAEVFAEEGSGEENSRKIQLSHYYTELSKSLRLIVEETQRGDGERSVRKRRKMLAGAGAMALGAIFMGSMSVSRDANAFVGGEAALIPYLQKLVADSQVSVYQNFVESVQNIQKLFQGLQALHGAFINGIDGLLVGNTQDTSKQIVTEVTAQEKTAEAVRDNARVNIEVNSVVGSGTCMQEAVETVDGALEQNEAQAPVVAVDTSVNKYLISEKRSDAQDHGLQVAKDIHIGNKRSFNGATMANTPIQDDQLAKEDSRKVYDRMVAKSPRLIVTELDRVAQTPKGQAYASAIATYYVRRGVAEGALAKLRQGRIKEPTVHQHLTQKIDAIRTAAAKSTNDDKAKVINSRLIAMSEEMLSKLQDIAGDDARPGMSKLESLEFQTYAKNNPTFYEYIRSTGPGLGPLLRELVDIQGTSLKFQLNSYKADREMIALLSNILLELQDSPVRVTGLNNMNRKGQ